MIFPHIKMIFHHIKMIFPHITMIFPHIISDFPSHYKLFSLTSVLSSLRLTLIVGEGTAYGRPVPFCLVVDCEGIAVTRVQHRGS